KMVQEASAHAADDKRKREAVDARNPLDGLIYQTEKTLAEHGASLDATTKGSIETALTEAKKALELTDAEQIRKATEELGRVSHKLAEAMYSKASQPVGDGAALGPTGGEQPESKPKDDVVEAEFEEVKE